MKSSLAFAGASLLQAASVLAGPFIQDVSLGEHYPYAVSLPQNNTETAPPAIVFLGGKGSLFSEQDTQSRDTVVSFGGPGWNVMKYYNGSREDADVMAAERFVTIMPYMYYYEERPCEGCAEPNFTTSGILDVIEDAKTKYTFDDNRIYLSGYSMGARAMWPLMEENPDYFAAAAVVAGTVYPNMTGLDAIVNLPLRQYAGEQDYEAVSQVYQHQRVEDQLKDLGSTVSELITLNTTHGAIQQDAYTTDLYSWFLTQNGAESDEAAASAEASDEDSADERSEAYASFSSWSSANSFSLYALGFPTESRPASPNGSGGATQKSNAESSDDDDSSSAAALSLSTSLLLAAGVLASYLH